ncbi:MAG TPA: energy transducer TonB [Gracilimonas sp.]|uniref:energy transducer TonB family protein n=1 Tax=Gracilimonas sp. TaxID=1974203 RepID=UPI002D929620|nr:energy transducer TonB [Gracilimonas sp.]
MERKEANKIANADLVRLRVNEETYRIPIYGIEQIDKTWHELDNLLDTLSTMNSKNRYLYIEKVRDENSKTVQGKSKRPIAPNEDDARHEDKEIESGQVNLENVENDTDKEGAHSDENLDKRLEKDIEKRSFYELKWEGDINRKPIAQPLPKNISNSEALITVRFVVKPDGKVGRIIPLRKMNPELEREVISTLKDWLFSKLPEDDLQKDHWVTITFKF